MQSTSNLSVVQASLILCVILLIESHANQRPSSSPFLQVAAQKLRLQTDGFSKTNKLSSSKFRENIVQVQRLQQQPVQQQLSVQSVHVTEQQQSVNDLPLVQDNEDSQQSTYTSTNTESVYGSVQGTPGVDFPNYSAIPNTRFSCDEVPFALGMYADESTGCQVYHLCYQGRRESFLCGIGTVFNQAILNCDFWHSVDCSKSSLHYGINSEFGKSVSEPSGNSLQSFSQRTISQTEQSVLPVGKINLQAVKNYQQSSIIQPASPNFVQNQRNFESIQQFSGGKISPPRQQITSNFASQVINEQLAVPQSTKSFHSLTRAGITSPSRKAAQLNRVISGSQQITSAESATVRSLSSIKSGKTNLPLKSSAYRNQITVEKQHVPDLGVKSPASLSKGNSLMSIKQQSLEQSDDQIWKPVFRNKGKTSSASTTSRPVVSSVPAAPVKQITDATSGGTASTVPDGGLSTSVRPDLPPPTVARPDQEPTFSSIESPEPSTASEVPSIPKSDTPPSTESPVSSTNAPSTETSPSVNIESDVSSALGTTTPKPTTNSEEGSSSTSSQPDEPDTGTPPTNETLAVTTPATTTQTVGETSSQGDAESPKPTTTASIDQTTKPSDSVPDVSTTTTVSPAPEAETTTQAATTTTTAQPETTTTTTQPETTTTTTSKPESDDKTDQEEKAKKKRGALVAGVEYSNKSDGKKFGNSSSVVYVAKKESKIEVRK